MTNKRDLKHAGKGTRHLLDTLLGAKSSKEKHEELKESLLAEEERSDAQETVANAKSDEKKATTERIITPKEAMIAVKEACRRYLLTPESSSNFFNSHLDKGNWRAVRAYTLANDLLQALDSKEEQVTVAPFGQISSDEVEKIAWKLVTGLVMQGTHLPTLIAHNLRIYDGFCGMAMFNLERIIRENESIQLPAKRATEVSNQIAGFLTSAHTKVQQHNATLQIISVAEIDHYLTQLKAEKDRTRSSSVRSGIEDDIESLQKRRKQLVQYASEAEEENKKEQKQQEGYQQLP